MNTSTLLNYIRISSLLISCLFFGLFSCTDDSSNDLEVTDSNSNTKINDDHELINKHHKESILILSLVDRTIHNIYAPEKGGEDKPSSGPYTKFDMSTSEVTFSNTNWDIAFRGTTVIFNGGEKVNPVDKDEPERTGKAAAYIVRNTTFYSVSGVNRSKLRQDEKGYFAIPSGSDQGWYHYNLSKHIITPIEGTIIVFKTRDGFFGKLQILSYYKNAPKNPSSGDPPRHYTFRCLHQHISYKPKQ